MEPMFSSKILKEECHNIEISQDQEKNAKRWLKLLDEGKLESESANNYNFPKIILEGILGYDNDHINPESNRADYKINNNEDKTIICIERKGLNRNLLEIQSGYDEEKKTPLRQAWDYQSKSNSKYGIATNHNKFILLDKEFMFTKMHEFDFETIKTDINNLKEFIGIFGKNRLMDSNLDDIHNKTESEQKNITDRFYSIYHETRLMLLDTFKKNNISHELAVEEAQIFLNKIMFYFFAADKNMVSGDKSDSEFFYIQLSDRLKNPTKSSRRISDFILHELFDPLNEGQETPKIFGFNGGLFQKSSSERAFFRDLDDSKDLIKIQKTTKIKHEPNTRLLELFKNKSTINPIIKNLLIMDSYDFRSEITVNILGHIFEQSVDVVEKLIKNGKGSRKNTGVYYTPDYITKYICDHTIIQYLSKTAKHVDLHDMVLEYVNDDTLQILEEKMKKIRILDPACGSGAFLVQAAKTLLDIHKIIRQWKMVKGKYDTPGKQTSLERWSDESKITDIMTENIFGIDISPSSIEIAKLSVFFKVATNETKLPDLKNNIVAGNTLLPADNLTSVEGAFDWKKHFGDIMKQGGFDIIIGNPPYVRQETLGETMKKQIKIKDRNLSKKLDLSAYFYFRSVEKLREGGIIGFISSNTWMTTNYGKGVQELFLENEIQSIMRPTFKIFESAQTTPAIFFLKKNSQESNDNIVSLITFVSKNELLNNEFEQEIKIKQNELKIEKWRPYFIGTPPNPSIQMMKIDSMGTIKRGVVTGHKPFFILNSLDIFMYDINPKFLIPLVPKTWIEPGVLSSYKVEKWLFNVSESKGELGKMPSAKGVIEYITCAENTTITPKRGSDKTPKKIPKLKTLDARNQWYTLKLDDKQEIFIGRVINHFQYIFRNNTNYRCTNNHIIFNPSNTKIMDAYMAFLNSSLFGLYLEIQGTPMGGGALSIEIKDIRECLVPFFECNDGEKLVEQLTNVWNNYKNNLDLKNLDNEVLAILGFTSEQIIEIQKKLEITRKERFSTSVEEEEQNSDEDEDE